MAIVVNQRGKRNRREIEKEENTGTFHGTSQGSRRKTFLITVHTQAWSYFGWVGEREKRQRDSSVCVFGGVGGGQQSAVAVAGSTQSG